MAIFRVAVLLSTLNNAETNKQFNATQLQSQFIDNTGFSPCGSLKSVFDLASIHSTSNSNQFWILKYVNQYFLIAHGYDLFSTTRERNLNLKFNLLKCKGQHYVRCIVWTQLLNVHATKGSVSPKKMVTIIFVPVHWAHTLDVSTICQHVSQLISQADNP